MADQVRTTYNGVAANVDVVAIAGSLPGFASPPTIQPAGTAYEAVPVSTTSVMGGTGAAGDLLNGVLVVPGTTSPGAVQIKDGSGTAITVFTGGATSVSSLVPFFIYLGAKSTAGGWSVITGTNVTAIGVGSFT